MDAPILAKVSRWSALQLAAAKASAAAVLLAGFFFLMPGRWSGRITLAVAGLFWLNTFVFSLLSSWARAKVMARFPR
jgi:hypothetical protein